MCATAGCSKLADMTAVVLVTGGSGFIGSHVVDRLAARGYKARILDSRPSPWHDPAEVQTFIGDVRRASDVRRALQGCRAVCHLAAAADVGEVLAHPAWATELNCTGTLTVLDAARETGVSRVVYASTVWVYSNVDADEVDEDTLLPQPAHLYTAGKLAGELYCRSYAELYGLEPTIVRCGIPYGPRARPAAVIPSFVDRALRGEPLTIAGSGDQQRSFVYVEDLADGFVRALAPQAAGRTYNLAGRETTTIRGLAEIVRDEVADTRIVHTEARTGDLRGARVRSDRALAELGWRPETPLRDGVRRYAEWVREQPERRPVAVRAGDLPARLGSGPDRWGTRRLAAMVAAVARNPAAIGGVALVAVVSAAISAILGAREETQAADYTAISLALIMPLWPLTVIDWPATHRRLQAVLAAVTGVVGVLTLAVLNVTVGADAPHQSRIGLVLLLSVLVTSLLRVVPRRLADVDS